MKRRTSKQTSKEKDFFSTSHGQAVLKAASSPKAKAASDELLRILASMWEPDWLQQHVKEKAYLRAKIGMHEEEYYSLTPRDIHELKRVLRDEEAGATQPEEPAQQPKAAGPSLTLSQQRRAFVEPLLARNGWSDWDWMLHAKVDWKTVKRYLEGGKSYRNTRKKLANPLEIEPDSLP